MGASSGERDPAALAAVEGIGGMSPEEERDLVRASESGRRAVLFVPGVSAPEREEGSLDSGGQWRLWRECFERAGIPSLAPAAPALDCDASDTGAVVAATRERMLRIIDLLPLEPFVVGVDIGALVALRLADDWAAAGTVAIGGRELPPHALGIEPEGCGGPLLLMGGEHDPEVSVETMRARHRAYLVEGVDDAAFRLLLRPGSARELAFGPDWRQTAETALKFLSGPSRAERVKRFLADIWDTLIH